MKETLFAAMALLFACAVAADCAAQPAPPSAATPQAKEADAAKEAPPVKPESVIPKRELVFDQSEEEVPVYVPSAEQVGARIAELAQQRYVATFRLRFRWPYFSFSPYREIQHPKEQRSFDIPTSFLELASKVPADRLPSQELMAMLTTDRALHLRWERWSREAKQSDTGTKPGGPGTPPEDSGPGPPGSVRASLESAGGLFISSGEMSLVAPSPERAKELVQAVLSLYDHGFSYPTYKDFAEIRQHYRSKGSEARAAVEKVEAELDVLRKQRDELKEWSDITQETLANLVSQQRLVAVEEAGIKARIAACEKILKEGKGISAAQVQQVETAKTAAEIELVGSAAKRAAIEALVEKGRKRLTLSSRVSMSSSRLNRPKSILKSAEAREAAYKEALDQKMPFAEVEGKILVRRIRWEQPGAAPAKPPASSETPAKPRSGSRSGR